MLQRQSYIINYLVKNIYGSETEEQLQMIKT